MEREKKRATEKERDKFVCQTYRELYYYYRSYGEMEISFIDIQILSERI